MAGGLDRIFGLIDAIVPRKELKARLLSYLNFLTNGNKLATAV